MRTAVVFLFAVGLAVAAPVPKALSRPTDDPKLLEGRWEVVTIDSGKGPLVPTGDDATAYWEIRGGKLTAGTDEKPGWRDREIVIDSTRSPKWLDVPARSSSTLFIYEVDGDTLRTVHSQPALNRPTNFKGDYGLNVYTWKRVKE